MAADNEKKRDVGGVDRALIFFESTVIRFMH